MTASDSDLLAEIRQRDALKGHSAAGVTMTQAEADRRTLLRLLDQVLPQDREYDLHRVTMVATSDGTVRPDHVEHTPACDRLRYGAQCHFDHLVIDQGRGWPEGSGMYVAYVSPIREPCLRYARIGSVPGEAAG